MPRLIKDFGYHEKFGTNITVDTEDVEDLSEDPSFSQRYYVKISRNYREEIFDYIVKFSAFEDKPGVEITVYGCTREPKLYNGSIIVDEIEFADVLYDALINRHGEKLIKLIVKACQDTVTQQLFADGYWLYDIKTRKWYN